MNINIITDNSKFNITINDEAKDSNDGEADQRTCYPSATKYMYCSIKHLWHLALLYANSLEIMSDTYTVKLNSCYSLMNSRGPVNMAINKQNTKPGGI